jgi:periplasmic divalent cation tolerance protein
MSLISVYAVFANAEEAERIGRAVIEERLAACVNILGATPSIYRWKGMIETADEVAAIFKTTDDQAPALLERVAALHSYEVPCVVCSRGEKALPAYLDWVADSVR